jgi:hypothetical protein
VHASFEGGPAGPPSLQVSIGEARHPWRAVLDGKSSVAYHLAPFARGEEKITVVDMKSSTVSRIEKGPIRPRKKGRRLWRCLRCGRAFATRNQSHFCGSIRNLEEHFAGKRPGLRLLFARLLEEVQACGPVTVLPEKTRIAFHFMAVTVQQAALRGHFVFAERRNHPRFLRIETISRANHVHHFRLSTSGEINAEFAEWIRAAYAVGQQRHLR